MKKIRKILISVFFCLNVGNCTPSPSGSNPTMFQGINSKAPPCGVSRAIPNAHFNLKYLIPPISGKIPRAVETAVREGRATRGDFEKLITKEIVDAGGLSRDQLESLVHNALEKNKDACNGRCEDYFKLGSSDLNHVLNDLFFKVSGDDSYFQTPQQRGYLIGSLRPNEEYYRRTFHRRVKRYSLEDEQMRLFREKYLPYDGQIPLGFEAPSKFLEFSRTAHETMQRLYPGTEMFIQGSSVTGYKYTTGAPFDVGRKSDYDIALVGQKIFEAGRDNIKFNRWGGKRSPPLNWDMLDKLGLQQVAKTLSKMSGRPVRFIISQSFVLLLEEHTSPLIRLPNVRPEEE